LAPEIIWGSTRLEERLQRAFPDVDVDGSRSKTRPMTGISSRSQ
jgi:hypothetical protein